MVLTREEKEKLVLDLYNQGKSTREIAQIAHMSFRDIGFIIDKKEKEQESKEGQTRQWFLSTQAYKLFSEGKSPVQVAIALNLQEPEVVKFYVEYWNLVQHHSLSLIYQEIKEDIGYFVRLYRLSKVARRDAPSVIRFLEIANNDLQSVEYRYERLKREADALEAEKRNSARIFQELSDQIATLHKRLDSSRLECEKEISRLQGLQQQRMKQEALVKHFENNNQVFDIKIRKTVEEKIVSILSNSKTLLKLALLSLTESMKKDPDTHSHLIHNNNASSTPRTQATDYDTASYGQQQQYPSQDYITRLLEEAVKLYNKLVKELVDEIISDYGCSISSSPLLALFV